MADYIRKIVMLGDSAVGKTSLVRKYVDNMFEDKYLSTIGAKPVNKKLKFGNDSVVLMIWDLAGQSFALHPAYYSGAKGALLVCDITKKDSADSLKGWKSMLVSKTGEVPIIALANKADLPNHKFGLDYLEAIGFETMSTSAKTGDNVEKAFTMLAERIIHE